MSKKSKRQADDARCAPTAEQQKELRKSEETPKGQAADLDKSAAEFSELFDPPKKR
jgi:hypothetical protein